MSTKDGGIVTTWKDKKLSNMTQVLDAALKITDPQEAEAFVKLHEDAGIKREIFLGNLGYFAGYYDQKVLTHINKVFGASHPFFGVELPSPEETFEKGAIMAASALLPKGAK